MGGGGGYKEHLPVQVGLIKQIKLKQWKGKKANFLVTQ